MRNQDKRMKAKNKVETNLWKYVNNTLYGSHIKAEENYEDFVPLYDEKKIHPNW